MSNIKLGWVKNSQGERFAPKTFASQVITKNGRSIEDLIEQSGSNVSTPDWEQNDAAASDYIKNKPFYDSRVYDEKEFTFDGNIEGREIIDYYQSEYTDEEGGYTNKWGSGYVKLSDEHDFKEEDFIGKTFTMYSQATDETINYKILSKEEYSNIRNSGDVDEGWGYSTRKIIDNSSNPESEDINEISYEYCFTYDMINEYLNKPCIAIGTGNIYEDYIYMDTIMLYCYYDTYEYSEDDFEGYDLDSNIVTFTPGLYINYSYDYNEYPDGSKEYFEWSNTYLSYISLTSVIDGELKQIDNKFINFPSSAKDWEENDKNSSKYIENRTHWKEPYGQNTFWENDYLDPSEKITSFNTIVPYHYLSGWDLGPAWEFLESYEYPEDAILEITFDNEQYTCYGHAGERDNRKVIAFGDTNAILKSSGPDNDCPFCLAIINNDESYYGSNRQAFILVGDNDPHSVSVKSELSYNYYPLDEKYIPDSIARQNDLYNSISYVENLIVQSDWNQNNEGAIDYVKNRTHWVEEGREVVLAETNESEVMSEPIQSGNWGEDIAKEINVGETYIVTFDGVEYECVSYLSSMEWITLGDSRLGEEKDDFHVEDVPFAVQYSVQDIMGDMTEFAHAYYMWYEDYEISHTIKIEKQSDELSYHTLDEKFIPEEIARKDDISNMVFITIDTIDEICGK